MTNNNPTGETMSNTQHAGDIGNPITGGLIGPEVDDPHEADRRAMIEVVLTGIDEQLRRYRYRIANHLRALPVTTEPFQSRVEPWLLTCFGAEIAGDRLERGDRLLEEVFELLQAGEYPRERVASLSSYVWSRPAGEPAQEVGGVMVTLAAYCLAHGLDMHAAGETELARVWTKVEKIRAKQAAKPVGSALPQVWPTEAPAGDLISREAAIAAIDDLYRIHRWEGSKEGADALDDAEQALRALPAATEAGEVERLRARITELEAERDASDHALVDKYRNPKSGSFRFPGDVSAIIRKLEGERDAALAQVAGAYEAAAKVARNREIHAKGETARACRGIAVAVSMLTPADATAAFERAVEDRVQVALAAQGEPVAWRIEDRTHPGWWTYYDPKQEPPIGATPLYAHPAPASAGVTEKALLALAELASIGVNCSLNDWVRISGSILAAISQPAQGGEGGA